MHAYWFRRKDSRGKWWSVYVCTPQDCEYLRERDGYCYGRTVFDERRIYINAAMGNRHYLATLIHEWAHVEQHNQWLYDGDYNGRMHRAIEATAAVAARLPKRPPPRKAA